MDPTNSNPKQVLLDKLEVEIGWQWKWERHNRCLYMGSQWISWLANLTVFSLALVLAQPGFPQTLVPRFLIVIASLSGLAVFVQVLNHTMKFGSRQVLHDGMAREYEVVLTLLKADHIELSKAFKRFEAIHKRPNDPQLK